MSTSETNTLSAIRPLTGGRGVRFTMLSMLAGLALAMPAVAQSGTPDTKPQEPAGDKAAAPSDARVNKLDLPFDNLGTNKDDPNAAVVYLIKVRGEAGLDFTATPLRRIMADARRVKADIIVLDIDSEYRPLPRGRQRQPEEPFFKADNISKIATVLVDDVASDPQWEKKPRIVSWVRRATGPGAFLPFVTKEIYYTPTARHGAIGYLDFAFAGRGAEEVVKEKWRGASLKAAEGIAVKGGHDPRIIRAMARMDYVLSYTMVGGKPDFHEDMSGDTILTDDGNPDAGRADTAEQVVRGEGDDVLNLNTVVAKRIGFINGEAATLDDLAFELGVQRAYRVYGRRADRILSDWRAQVDSLEPQWEALLRERDEWQLQGETAAERNQSRARLKRVFQKMIDLVMRNPEISAAGYFGDPAGLVDNIRQEIARIDQQIRLDRDR